MNTIEDRLDSNPFETFKTAREEIVANAEFMRTLTEFAQTPFASKEMHALLQTKKVRLIGSGQENFVYGIGNAAGFWLAVRINKICHGSLQDELKEYESYIDEINWSHQKGILVPRVCGPIFAGGQNDPKTFLLVEDLTENDSRQITNEYATKYGVRDGKRFYYDMDTNRMRVGEIKHMTKENAVVLD